VSATITATAVDGAGRAIVTVTASPSGWGPWSLIRDQGGTLSTVRGISGLTGSTVAVDGEIALNVPATYRIRDDTTGVVSTTGAPVTVPATLSTVSDPITGLNVDPWIVSWDTDTPGPQSSLVWAVDASTPIVLVAPERAATTPLVILTETLAAADLLGGILASGDVFLVRPACPKLPTVHAVATAREVARFMPDDPDDETRIHRITIQRTGMPDVNTRALGDTLGDVNTAVPTTLGAINTRWGTLGAIAAANLKQWG